MELCITYANEVQICKLVPILGNLALACVNLCALSLQMICVRAPSTVFVLCVQIPITTTTTTTTTITTSSYTCLHRGSKYCKII